MKVGAKGRALCPPQLSYGDGKVAFDGDEQGEAKKARQGALSSYSSLESAFRRVLEVPAGATLYYDLELLGPKTSLYLCSHIYILLL